LIGFYSLKISTKEKKTIGIHRRKRKENGKILKKEALDFSKLIIITNKKPTSKHQYFGRWS